MTQRQSMAVDDNSGQYIYFMLGGSDNGNNIQCEQFVQIFRRKLLTTARKIVSSPEEAEDAVQDALCIASSKLHKFRKESSIKTWLYRIVINCAKNRLRAYLRRKQLIGCSIDENLYYTTIAQQLPTPNRIQPDRLLDNRLIYRQLTRVVSKLPRRSAAIVILRYWHNCSYQEISSLLHCPIGTVKSQLSRARKHITKELSHNFIAEV